MAVAKNTSIKPERMLPALAMLDEEIGYLRKRMERLIVVEQSFTAERVIQISRQLDEKINEYIRRAKKSR
ncbi:MAG TPA: aspartyl-phosphate phosphatase Spo0E family protein [Bacilli bacterium]